jgi:hypothetical protein
MKDTASKIPAEFWATQTGRSLCTAMHTNAWDTLDCLNAQIDAMAKASAETTDEAIKAEIEKAKAKVVAAREACRKAMAILKDTAF